ncbi:MAG: cation:proton antiporter [Polyangiales bacterium]
MKNLIILLALGSLVHTAQILLPIGGDVHGAAGTALAFGLLLLVAFVSGDMLARLRLPKLVGYILAGIAIGPHALGLVSENMIVQLDLIEGVAICLIALTAGGELDLKLMRPLLPTIMALTFWGVIGTGLLLGLGLFLASPRLGFLQSLEGPTLFAFCGMLGVVLSAQSPAVVMALLSETRAEGPVSRTILGTVVIADLVVIVLFSGASAVVRSMMTGEGDPAGTALTIAWELFGSMGSGVAIGILLAYYLRKIRQDASLFVVLLCIIVAEITTRVQLDPLIVMLSAGLVIANFGEPDSSTVVHDLQVASLPLYLVFFAVAGTTLHLDLLFEFGAVAAMLVVLRAFGFRVGGAIATRQARSPIEVRRWAWTGLLPQAGLALALALVVQRSFGDAGRGASALLLGVIALNELIMPVVLRNALVKSGEAMTRSSVVPVSRLPAPRHSGEQP